MALDPAVRRLAQFRPFAHDGMTAKGAVRDLVVAAAVEGDGRIASLGECRETCQTLWGLDVEIDELREAVESLSASGSVSKVNGGYELSEAVRAEAELTLQESAEIERTALEEWEWTLRSLQSGLTDDDIAALRDDLDLWVRQVMHRHGVEAALLLYPESPRAQEMFAELEKMGLDFLPSRSRPVESIREQAFALFVRRPTESQRIVLANLMNTAYFLTILSLDPEAKALVQEVAVGQRVYLDTNIVYRLLNLQTPRQFLSTQRLLELTTELGYTVAVTPWTVQELRTSLERARAYLRSKPIPPGELADLAASATTDENFITAYWRRLRDKPVSVDDFFDFYNEIEGHLAAHGVEVVTEGCVAVDRDEAAISEQLAILDSVPGPRFKADPVKEHDAKHRLLIMRLRGESARRFANAGFWFLTADSSLPRYDHAAQGGANRLPFCITAAAWLQVTRSLVPRTQDFDQTLTDLLASPYIRYRGRIGYDVVQEVVSRIDLFSGVTPDLAARLLFNTALLREVAEASDETVRQELIDNAVVAAAADLEKQVEEAQLIADQARKATQDAEARGDALAAEVKARRVEIGRLERELAEQRARSGDAADAAKAELEEERITTGSQITDLQRRIDDQDKVLASLRVNVRRVVGAVVVALAAIGAIASLAANTVQGPAQITIVITAAILVSAGGVAIAVGMHLATRVLLALGVVLGIAAAVYDFAKR